MPSLNLPQYRDSYWRSLSAQTGGPQEASGSGDEFPQPASPAEGGVPRRDFLKMMSMTLLAAGVSLSGCRRWPVKELRPHVSQPEGFVPGRAERYATLFELAGVATGVVVKSYEGRPIKVEGNSLHPFSLGAADAFAQASVLEMYDPDRSRHPVERVLNQGKPVVFHRTWDDFDRWAVPWFDDLRASGGEGLAVLSRPTSSPTLRRLGKEFSKALPAASWYVYEPLHRDEEKAGSRLAFGADLRPQYRLHNARTIACFEADLLGLHPGHQRWAREWARGRSSADDGHMNRLYVAEAGMSLTGSVADQRLAIQPSRALVVLRELARRLGVASAATRGAELAERERQWIEALASELRSGHGEALVAVGTALPAKAHALGHAINHAIGAMGRTVEFTADPDDARLGQAASLTQLSLAMRAGRVNTLVILDGNPCFDAPVELGFDPALVTSIHLSSYINETSSRSRWHLPMAHFLECWGDGRAWDGTYGVQQPLMLPLFDGRCAIELIGACLGLTTTAREQVRQTARELGVAGDGAWERLLHDGVLADSAWKTVRPVLREVPVDGTTSVPDGAASTPSGPALELLLTPSHGVYDGRFAENAWLQELPDPLSKLTWGNAAMMAKADADRMRVRTGDVVELRVSHAGKAVEVPVYVMPGHAPGVVSLAVGYGRTAGGDIACGVGCDVYSLRPRDAGYLVPGLTVRSVGRRMELASTQEHHEIDAVGMWGREVRVGTKGGSGLLVREAALEDYRADPHALAGHAHDDHQLFSPPSQFNDPHAWGMSIDLNKCLGCSACVVACQVENNVPVVGPRQVINNREMHWLRIDRYFRGPVEDPDVVHIPMACVHCENAPCEQVCPVAATVHDAEGLNTMVYNRCIGTRYCSNNCPYKTRRFNYFDYHSNSPRGTPKPWLGLPDQQQQQQVSDIRKLGFNPEVTVRMRGVMEKCTYCTQRLQEAKSHAKVEHAQGRRSAPLVAEGEVMTACQGACPTNAIVFGNLNDQTSAVARAQHHPRAYIMLGELNLHPRTRYMAKIRNPGAASDSSPPAHPQR